METAALQVLKRMFDEGFSTVDDAVVDELCVPALRDAGGADIESAALWKEITERRAQNTRRPPRDRGHRLVSGKHRSGDVFRSRWGRA